MPTIYGLKNCDTCKKAIKALEGADFVDIRAEADLASKVPKWLSVLGADALVNRRSTTWRNLDEATREAAMGDGAEAVLTGNPTLIKRPVIEANGEVTVGWTKDVQAKFG
ncbi:MAG: ArsC/Spx/MgsR family protein [Pseudomonadota bacterium]